MKFFGWFKSWFTKPAPVVVVAPRPKKWEELTDEEKYMFRLSEAFEKNIYDSKGQGSDTETVASAGTWGDPQETGKDAIERNKDEIIGRKKQMKVARLNEELEQAKKEFMRETERIGKARRK